MTIAVHRLSTMTEPDCPAEEEELKVTCGHTSILEDQAYQTRNAGKWVAVVRTNNRPICVHADMFEVDARAQKRGYSTDEYLLLRVPE